MLVIERSTQKFGGAGSGLMSARSLRLNVDVITPSAKLEIPVGKRRTAAGSGQLANEVAKH